MCFAAEFGHLEIVQFYLLYCDSITPKDKGSALAAAATLEHKEILYFLNKRRPSNFEVQEMITFEARNKITTEIATTEKNFLCDVYTPSTSMAPTKTE